MKLIRYSFPLWFFLVYVVAIGLSSSNHIYGFPLCLIGFSVVSAVFSSRFDLPLSKVLLYFSLPFFVVMLITAFLPRSLSSYSILYGINALIAPIIGSLLQKKRYVVFVLTSFFYLVAVFIVEPTLTNYLANLNKTKEAIAVSYAKLDLYYPDGTSFEIKKDELVVLDLWHMRCGACFNNFPFFERLKDDITLKNDNVRFYSVNVPLRQEVPDSSIAFFNSLGYTIDPLFASSRKNLEEVLGYNSYPHYAILSSDSLHFSGKFDFSELLFLNRPETILEDVINTN